MKVIKACFESINNRNFQQKQKKMLPNYSTDDNVLPSSLNSTIDDNLESISVNDFYKDKTIFITGVTGFIGKVLLEKILRKCSSVRKIYLLIRPNSSESCHERLNKMLTTSILFKNHQDKIDLIQAIDGDITVKDLGISENDRQRLIEEVDVVFHSAASIQFTGVLEKFIKQNIQGTDSLMRLCQNMKHVQSIVYVSTAYGNCHLNEIKEKIYPVVNDQDVEVYLKQLIEKYSDHDLCEGHSALQKRPNPYTLSKAIAEWLIKEKYQSTLPIIVCRPSIVLGSHKEPFPGWCDAISGVSGSFLLLGLGIGQKFIVDKTKNPDLIPVDLVVNSLIVCGAYRASSHYSPERNVVHINTSTLNPISWGKFFQLCINFERHIPSIKQVRPVSIDFSNNYSTVFEKISYKFNQIFDHLLFAVIFDLICMIMGQKPFMLKIIQVFHKTMFELKFFSLRQWNFEHENMPFIYKLVNEKERPSFNCDVTKIEWEDFCFEMCKGLRRYLLKDPDTTVEQAKRRQNRIYLGFRLFAVFKYFVFYFLCKKYLLQTILGITLYSLPLSIIDLVIYSYLIRSVFVAFISFNKSKSFEY